MTTVPISDGDPKNIYIASAGQTVFPYTFWVNDEAHIAVYQNGTLLTLTADYTVSAIQSVTGANIVLTSGATLADSIVIVYDPEYVRTADYTGTIRLDALNTELVYLLTLVKSNLRKIDDSLRPSDSETATFSGELPSLTGSGGKVLSIKTDLSGIELLTPNTDTYLSASAFALTLLDDADAATARATLGAVIGTNVQAHNAYLDTIAAAGSAAPFADTIAIVKGSADATKLARFEVDGLTTATTRVLTVPDKDITIAGTDDIPDAPQTLQTFKSDTASMSSSTFADLGMSVAITPTATSSKVLVRAVLQTSGTSNTTPITKLLRDSTDIGIADSAGNRIRAGAVSYSTITTGEMQATIMEFLDSPSTTSAVTYKIQWRSLINGQAIYLNRSVDDSDTTTIPRAASSLTVQEILA